MLGRYHREWHIYSNSPHSVSMLPNDIKIISLSNESHDIVLFHHHMIYFIVSHSLINITTFLSLLSLRPRQPLFIIRKCRLTRRSNSDTIIHNLSLETNSVAFHPREKQLYVADFQDNCINIPHELSRRSNTKVILRGEGIIRRGRQCSAY